MNEGATCGCETLGWGGREIGGKQARCGDKAVMASSGRGPIDAAGDGGRARSTRIIDRSGSDETKILDDRGTGERRRMDVPRLAREQ